MTVGLLYSFILIGLLVVAIIVGFLLHLTFKNTKTVNMAQGKLANSDTFIADVIDYLKITNEWSDENGSK